MPFRVDGPPPGELRPYIPEALGNRSLAEPMRLVLRNPTEAQKRDVYAQFRTAVKVGQDGKAVVGADGRPEVVVDARSDDGWRRRVLEHCLVSVENFQIRGAQDTWVNVSAEDFHKHAPRELYNEVTEEALTAFSLSDEAKKKSAESSASLPAMTRPSDGTAASVAPKGSAPHEAATARQHQTSVS